MNWTLFYGVFSTAFILSAPMFWILNKKGIRTGRIPVDNNTPFDPHYGRRFAHWKEETTLYVGNPFFFSLMFALVATSFEHVNWDVTHIVWASNSILGLVVTYLWFARATRNYATGEFKSWGWQWCGPNQISIAGWYHTIYFAICAVTVTNVLTFLLWQPNVIIHNKMGMIFALAGYVATARHFVYIQKRLDMMQESWNGMHRYLHELQGRLDKAQQRT